MIIFISNYLKKNTFVFLSVLFVLFSNFASASVPVYGAWNPHEATTGDCVAHLTAAGSIWSFYDVLTTYDSNGKVSKCRAVCTVSLELCTTNYFPNNPNAIASGFAPTHYQAASCLAGEIFSSGECVVPTCPPDTVFAPDNISCVVPRACTNGEVYSSGIFEVAFASDAPATSACVDNCEVAYNGGSGSLSRLVNGVMSYFAEGSYVYNGWNCETYGPAAEAVPPGSTGATVPPNSCPEGQIFEQNIYGYVCAIPSTAPSASTLPTSSSTSDPTLNSAPVVSTTTGTSTTVTNPDGSTTTTSTSTTVAPTFPDDYAKSGESMAAANVLKDKLDVLHADLSGTSDVVDPLEIDSATMPTFSTTFDSLAAWGLPSHVSTCPAPTIDLSGVLGGGNVYSFDAHCMLVQNHFASLQASMMVVWSILALFVVLRA